MDPDAIESAITTLVENQDEQHYPVRTLALKKIIDDLESLNAQLRELEGDL